MLRFQGKILVRGSFRIGGQSFTTKGLVTWIDAGWENAFAPNGLLDRASSVIHAGKYSTAGQSIVFEGNGGVALPEEIGNDGFTVGALIKATGPGTLWGDDTQLGYDGTEWVLANGDNRVVSDPVNGWQNVIATVNRQGVGTLYLGSVKEGFSLSLKSSSHVNERIGNMPAQVAEMAVWNRALSVAERNQFNLYLQEKWAVG